MWSQSVNASPYSSLTSSGYSSISLKTKRYFWKTLFLALLGNYNKDQYRFEFNSVGARNNALKLLERNGFDYDLVVDLKGYMVQLPKSAKYTQILKNSVAFKETANERIFLMKDLDAVEEAVNLGAKIYEGDISF
jgi:hypothetical protein